VLKDANFVILFVGRSGSSWLVEALHTHPRIVARGEELVGRGAADQMAWAQRFYARSLLRRGRAKGFKTKLIDVADAQGFADVLRRSDCRVITLVRHNAVRQTISWSRSEALYDAHGRHNTDDPGQVPGAVRIEPSEFVERLGWIEEGRQEVLDFAAGLGLPLLGISYEDMVTDTARTFAAVQRFIGVEPRPLNVGLIKMTGENLAEAVSNLDELREAVGSAEHRRMFE
jgi:LPS sulfotransferase NodH